MGIRKRIKMSSEKAIFIFINSVLPPTAALMSSIYEEQKDEDGFLYITYSGENTFGGLEELSSEGWQDQKFCWHHRASARAWASGSTEQLGPFSKEGSVRVCRGGGRNLAPLR